MKTQSRWLAKLSTVLLLVLLGVIWVIFAPFQFGGQSAYVIVNGNSMEPLYHRGDLVIIRSQPDYQIGDIVTYRHPQIGPVIHRIIGRDTERFIFKGDHNTFIDPYRPLKSDLIGTSWILLPSVGIVLSQLRTPRNMALLAAVAGVIIMAPNIQSRNRPTTRKRNRQQSGQTPTQSPHGSISINEGLITMLVGLTIASIVLAAFAFTSPLSRNITKELTYQQTGSFSYSAIAPDGLYDSGSIQTGEPLFPALTNDVTFSFDYRFTANQPAAIHGTHRMLIEIRAANGWQRSIEIQPATSFSGNSSTANGVLQFSQVQALINNFEQQTGLLRQQYTLTIVPEVVIEGTLAGQTLVDTYQPRLELRFDQTQLQLPTIDSNGVNPLKPSKEGLISYTHPEPNDITILFLKLEVQLARWLSIGGVSLALIGLFLIGLLDIKAGPIDEAARIQSKYSALLIHIKANEQPTTLRVLEIATIDDLAKLADKNGQMILHEVTNQTHSYTVYDENITYRYRAVCTDSDQLADPSDVHPLTTPSVQSAWQGVFLCALREQGTISEACRVAGIEIVAAYNQRLQDPAFAQAWNETRSTLHVSQSRRGIST